MVRFCKKCVTPSSRPRITFDKNGVCNACQVSIKKKRINWEKRKIIFLGLIKEIKKYSKKNKLDYDCIVPWSGGKDSTSIALKLKLEYDLNPLLVNFSPLMVNKTGAENRNLLIKKGFDTIFFKPNLRVSKILAKRFFVERGNPKVAWDAGINSVPTSIAIKYKIPFIFYAEHGESEYGGHILNKNSSRERDFEEVIEHQIGDFPENWTDEKINHKDLSPYIYPDKKILIKNKIKAYYFSYFFKWSMFENYEYVKKNLPGFKENPFGRTEGTFTNFDSLDDQIDDLYYYMQYIKFGFGRATRDASRFIQNNHMKRNEAIKIVRKYDGEFPYRNIEKVIRFLNISELELDDIINKHRNLEIWKKKNNDWELKNKI